MGVDQYRMESEFFPNIFRIVISELKAELPFSDAPESCMSTLRALPVRSPDKKKRLKFSYSVLAMFYYPILSIIHIYF